MIKNHKTKIIYKEKIGSVSTICLSKNPSYVQNYKEKSYPTFENTKAVSTFMLHISLVALCNCINKGQYRNMWLQGRIL